MHVKLNTKEPEYPCGKLWSPVTYNVHISGRSWSLGSLMSLVAEGSVGRDIMQHSGELIHDQKGDVLHWDDERSMMSRNVGSEEILQQTSGLLVRPTVGGTGGHFF